MSFEILKLTIAFFVVPSESIRSSLIIDLVMLCIGFFHWSLRKRKWLEQKRGHLYSTIRADMVRGRSLIQLYTCTYVCREAFFGQTKHVRTH